MKITSENDTVILLLTHFIDDIILDEFRKIRSDVAGHFDTCLVYNTTEETSSIFLPEDLPVFRFDRKDLLSLDYPRKQTDIKPCNVELFALNFALRHPNYKFFWIMEYDVRFSGNWLHLFQYFQSSPSDLIASTIFRYMDHPEWENWQSLCLWGIPVDITKRVRAFLPIYRLSTRAFMTLHHAYRQGWSGHCEATVSSILENHHFEIEDMGGKGEFVKAGNENLFYHNTPFDQTLSPGTLVYRPILKKMGLEPNKIWHPVKSRPGMPVGRRERFLRKTSIWMRKLI